VRPTLEHVQAKVLYVGGMPRSGSTLLTWMLGELPDHVAVGELYYVWSSGVAGNQLCGCGEQFHACPFWTKVGDIAFGGWHNVDAAAMLRLADKVDATSRIPMILAARLLPRFRAAQYAYVEQLTRLYAAVAQVSGCSTVVDGSKRPSLAFLLAAAADVDLRVVHVLRDPRAVVYSWSKQVALPEGAGKRGYLRVRSTRQITRRWVTVNALIGLLRRRGVPLARVRYEELVAAPHQQLTALAAFSGLPTQGDPAGFVQGSEVHLHPAHMVEGGRVRFASSPLLLSYDAAWESQLPLRRRRVVQLATGVARRRYGYR
jgi:Sulfotransferase family